MRVPVACPLCLAGVVVVERASWDTPGLAPGLGRRGGVWVDEPVRCSKGCAVPSEDVRRLLTRVLEEPERVSLRQLGFWDEEAAG